MKFEQAKSLMHGQEIHLTGEFNSDGSCARWRVNGKVKLWKRFPKRIEIPLKWGLYGFCYLNGGNLKEWHLPNECEEALLYQRCVRHPVYPTEQP